MLVVNKFRDLLISESYFYVTGRDQGRGTIGNPLGDHSDCVPAVIGVNCNTEVVAELFSRHRTDFFRVPRVTYAKAGNICLNMISVFGSIDREKRLVS